MNSHQRRTTTRAKREVTTLAWLIWIRKNAVRIMRRVRIQPSDWNAFEPSAPAIFSGKALWSGNIGAKVSGRSSYNVPQDNEPKTVIELPQAEKDSASLKAAYEALAA